MRSDVLVAAGAVAAEVAAQAIDANGCLRLVGSVACPGCEWTRPRSNGCPGGADGSRYGLHRLTLILLPNFHPTMMPPDSLGRTSLVISLLPVFPFPSPLCLPRSCPTVASSYINPSNLSNAFPWMDTVTDVTSFDIAALNYFTDPYEWQATKFERAGMHQRQYRRDPVGEDRAVFAVGEREVECAVRPVLQ